MTRRHRETERSKAPALRPRAKAFGALLLLFAVAMLVAGLGIGVTKVGLPPERHPCLLLDRSDIPRVRERLVDSPYAGWYERLLAMADEDSFVFDTRTNAPNARHAKAMAMAYVLSGERRFADGAAAILRRAKPPVRGGRWGGMDDLVQGAADYAITYDLLAGYLRSDEVLAARTRLLLHDLGKDLYSGRYIWPNPGGDTREIRQYSALGLCALAISDHATPRDEADVRAWHRRAKTRVLEALNRQVCPDGAYAAGPGPQFEAASLYLPFLLANRRVTGDDLIADKALSACEWSLRLRLPDGMRPNIDSSDTVPSPCFALTSSGDSAPLYRWDMETSEASVLSMPDALLPEAIALYDHEVDPVAPSWNPSQVFPTSGDVVFRDGWGDHAGYFLLRAERAKSRTAGGAFEQQDATSFVLAKGSETLAMDTGYGGWARREETRGGAAHNMLLVDGQGPPLKTALGAVLAVGVDVQMADLMLDDVVDAVRVRRSHLGGYVDRAVIFADKRHVILMDRAHMPTPGHDFTWQLHVNGGGTTGGEVVVDGNTARVERPRGKMHVFVHAPDGKSAVLRAASAPHYLAPGQRRHHTVLRATTRDQSIGRFVAVLSPMATRGKYPEVTATQKGGVVHLSIDDDQHALLRLSGDETLRNGDLGTDGYALHWSQAGDGTIRHVLAMGATKLWVADRLVWSSREPASHVWHGEPAPKRVASTR